MRARGTTLGLGAGAILGGGAWTPASLGALHLWVAAGTTWCFEDDAGTDPCENTDGVAFWSSQGGLNQHLTQTVAGSRPQFQTAGWNGAQPAVVFDGAGDVLTRTAGLLLLDLAGSDKAFTLFATLQCDAPSQDQSLFCWDNSAGNERMNIRTENGLNNRLRIERVDAAGTLAAQNGSAQLTTARRRLVVYFSGTTISTWVDGTLDVNAAAMDVGSLTTLNRFRMGNGTSGSFSGRIPECVLQLGDASAHVANYQAYSVATWGG